MKIGLFFQEITFITEFLGSSLLLSTFLTGGKWDFQVANLLLASVNLEHWHSHVMILLTSSVKKSCAVKN